MHAAGIMDYVQALFSFFIAPLLGAILLGMFWKRATKAGGFWGLLMGTLDLGQPVGLGQVRSRRRCATLRSRPTPSPWPRTCIAPCGRSCTSIVVNVIVSLFTKPRPVAELDGLVYGATIAADGRAGAVLQERVVLDGDRASSSFWRSQHLLLVRRSSYAWLGEFQSGFSSACCSSIYGALIFGYGLYELDHRQLCASVQSGQPACAGLVGRFCCCRTSVALFMASLASFRAGTATVNGERQIQGASE